MAWSKLSGAPGSALHSLRPVFARRVDLGLHLARMTPILPLAVHAVIRSQRRDPDVVLRNRLPLIFASQAKPRVHGCRRRRDLQDAAARNQPLNFPYFPSVFRSDAAGAVGERGRLVESHA